MTAEGHKVASLHGAKDASERDAVIDSFREGREKVLITTNVIARGIDILQVNMVVNYDLPLMNERGNTHSHDGRPDIETYIHRIGAFICVVTLCCTDGQTRANWAFWTQRHIDQLCPRPEDVAADGGDRKDPWKEDYSH